jgi:flavin-dependent dehydrogenase
MGADYFLAGSAAGAVESGLEEGVKHAVPSAKTAAKPRSIRMFFFIRKEEPT